MPYAGTITDDEWQPSDPKLATDILISGVAITGPDGERIDPADFFIMPPEPPQGLPSRERLAEYFRKQKAAW